MFKWLTTLFRKKKLSVIEEIHISRHEVHNPWLEPNNVNYKFPDPLKLQCVKVKFKCRKKRKRQKK